MRIHIYVCVCASTREKERKRAKCNRNTVRKQFQKHQFELEIISTQLNTTIPILISLGTALDINKRAFAGCFSESK